MSILAKSLVASAALIACAAFAQGTPPKTGVTDPAVGAGQRSSQNTPMGTTGTPAGGATTGSTAAGSTGSTATIPPATSGSTSGSTASSGTTGSGSASMNTGSTGGSTTTASASTTRRARADRN